MGSKSGGGGSSSSKSMSYSSETTTPNPQAGAAYSNVLNRAQDAANTPYEAYKGQLVAGLSNDQNAAFQRVRDLQNASQGYYDQGRGYVGDAVNSMTSGFGDSINRYMSPYVQKVVDATRANLQENNALQMNNLVGNAVKMGAMGGDRVGVAKAEMARNQKLSDDQTIANLYNSAYNNAAGMTQAAANLGLGAASSLQGLGNTSFQNNLQSANALMQSGNMQQQQQQRELDSAYNQWMQAKQYPYAQTGWLANVTNATGPNMGSTTSGWQMGQSENTRSGGGGGVAGALTSGLGLLNNMGGSGGLFSGLGSVLGLFSDENDKTDIKHLGRDRRTGLDIYAYRYKDDPKSYPKTVGPMAQDIQDAYPEMVDEIGGHKVVRMAAGGGLEEGAGQIGGGLTWIPQTPLTPSHGLQPHHLQYLHPSAPEPGGGGGGTGDLAKGLGNLFKKKPGTSAAAPGSATAPGEATAPAAAPATASPDGAISNKWGDNVPLPPERPVGLGATQLPQIDVPAAQSPLIDMFGGFGSSGGFGGGGGGGLFANGGPVRSEMYRGGLPSDPRDLMIRTLYGEAGGEPDQGVAAVAHVIQNRLNSGRWGDNLRDVILAPKQFSMWNPGNAAGRNAMGLDPNGKQYSRLASILDAVQSGSIADPTGGALNYYNPSVAHPAWGDKMAQTGDVMIGHHRFVGGHPDAGLGGATQFANAPLPPSRPVGLGDAQYMDAGSDDDTDGLGALFAAKGGRIHAFRGASVDDDQPDNFGSAVNQTLKFEGGYTPNDAGAGPTNFGINSRANPDVDVAKLSKDDARQLYRDRYWNSIGADKLPPSLARVAFDTSVMAGPGRAKEFLEQSGGDVGKFMNLREGYLNHLVESNPDKYGRYAKAWNNRNAELRRTAGLDTASAPMAYTSTGSGGSSSSPGLAAIQKILAGKDDDAADLTPPPPEKGLLFDKDVGNAMISAGLGMMASRNPSTLGAIGEGGLIGMSAYNNSKYGALDDMKERLQMENLRSQMRDRKFENAMKAFSLSQQIEAANKLAAGPDGAVPSKSQAGVSSGSLTEGPLVDGGPLNLPSAPQESSQREGRSASEGNPQGAQAAPASPFTPDVVQNLRRQREWYARQLMNPYNEGAKAGIQAKISDIDSQLNEAQKEQAKIREERRSVGLEIEKKPTVTPSGAEYYPGSGGSTTSRSAAQPDAESVKGDIDQQTGAMKTAIPSAPAGGGYPSPNIPAGSKLIKVGKEAESLSKTDEEMQKQLIGSQPTMETAISRYRALAQAFKMFQSGSGADAAKAVSQWISYFNPSSDEVAKAGGAMQWVQKEGPQLVLAELKAATPRFAQAEFTTLSNKSVPDITKMPQANHQIIAEGLGGLLRNQAFARDWAEAQKQGWASVSSFYTAWAKANPMSKFIKSAQNEIGNFKGMPFDRKNAYEGRIYTAPVDMNPAARRAWSEHGINPGDMFRYTKDGPVPVSGGDAWNSYLEGAQ